MIGYRLAKAFFLFVSALVVLFSFFRTFGKGLPVHLLNMDICAKVLQYLVGHAVMTVLQFIMALLVQLFTFVFIHELMSAFIMCTVWVVRFPCTVGIIVIRVSEPCLALYLTVEMSNLFLDRADICSQFLKQDFIWRYDSYRTRSNIDADMCVIMKNIIIVLLSILLHRRHSFHNKLYIVSVLMFVPLAYDTTVLNKAYS